MVVFPCNVRNSLRLTWCPCWSNRGWSATDCLWGDGGGNDRRSHRRNHPPPGVQFLRRKLLKFLPSKWGRWSNKFPNQRPWAAGFQIVGSYSWNLLHRSYIFFFEVVKLLKVWAATIVSWFHVERRHILKVWLLTIFCSAISFLRFAWWKKCWSFQIESHRFSQWLTWNHLHGSSNSTAFEVGSFKYRIDPNKGAEWTRTKGPNGPEETDRMDPNKRTEWTRTKGPNGPEKTQTKGPNGPKQTDRMDQNKGPNGPEKTQTKGPNGPEQRDRMDPN